MSTVSNPKTVMVDLILTEEEESVFVSRIHRCIDGIWEFRDWYAAEKHKIVLRKKMKDNSFYLYAKEISAQMPLKTKNMLSQTSPPSPEHMKSLDVFKTTDLVQYFVLVLLDIGGWELYSGSATEKKEGFQSRQRSYTNKTETRPEFLRRHDFEGKSYTMFGPMPTFLAPRTSETLADSGVTVLLIESIMMIFMRTLPSGGAYDELLIYSPFTEAQAWWSRRNRCMSLREWPQYADLSLEETKEAEEATKARARENERNYVARMTDEEKLENKDRKRIAVKRKRANRTEAEVAEDAKKWAEMKEALGEDGRLEMNRRDVVNRHAREAKETEEEREARLRTRQSRAKEIKAKMTVEERAEKRAEKNEKERVRYATKKASMTVE